MQNKYVAGDSVSWFPPAYNFVTGGNWGSLRTYISTVLSHTLCKGTLRPLGADDLFLSPHALSPIYINKPHAILSTPLGPITQYSIYGS